MTEGRVSALRLDGTKTEARDLRGLQGGITRGPIWPNDAGLPKPSEHAQEPTRWTRFYALRNAEDEDEVITFGFVEGTLEELRARQSKGGYGNRRSATDEFVESKTVDGVYEVLVERSIV
jgi:hypothetical protein